MTSVLLLESAAGPVPRWADDLAQAGAQVLGTCDATSLLGEVARQQPDVVVACWPRVVEAELKALSQLQAALPRPVLVFTDDARSHWMEAALAAGVQTWVVNGYAPERLHALLRLTQARFAQEQALRKALCEAQERLEERKWLDRAKGLLMQSQPWTEDEAFARLRRAAMQRQQRIGELAKQVVAASRWAEAVNRAGRLRMVSQRVAKLQTFRCGVSPARDAEALIAQSMEQAHAHLQALRGRLLPPSFADLLDASAQALDALQALVTLPPSAQQLGSVDDAAEQLLHRAERLTTAIEADGALDVGERSLLQLVNLAGRQRMLSQRVAKLALMERALGLASQGQDREAVAETFERALCELASIPLFDDAAHGALLQAHAAWQAMLAGAAQPDITKAALQVVAESEALLRLFDGVTERQSRNLQALIGPALWGQAGSGAP